ncbi:klarsicht protein isoform X2 [Leptopilina boulardi]|nr:klarsicht protein isoform X2 [Leptopilina boulardi]XP_051157474.1 klarsicht protein isoform X2 [Leptopilina boulardi]
MKMSFSLSSLQPSSKSLEGPEHVRMQVERPYNSLTKKRKEPKQEHCQCISENREDTVDDFWASIRTNYDYIMDTNLIDSCKEANGELAWDEGDVSTLSWGLNEVSCQFSELYSWLRVLQELVYSKEENLLDKGLRAAHMEELRRKAYRRRLFNEQAGKLIAREPALRDEITWRVDHLNAKWELVEQIMAPTVRPVTDHQDVSADFDHEVKCLRKWLREMETRMQPLSFHIDWSRAELEEKAMEHMVLQKDIEAHGRIVSSVVKLGEKLATQGEDQQKGKNEERQQHPALRVASSLERRWHLLFLRALEWQCHFETLASRTCNKNSVSSCCSSDSDEEPVTKQPRLSRRQSRESGREGGVSTSGQNAHSTRSSGRTKRVKALRHCPSSDPGTWKGDLSDSDVSSENRFIDDGSYFEDDLDELCVMETSVDEIKNYKFNRIALDSQGDEGDNEDADTSQEIKTKIEMAPTPDPVSVTARTLISIACDEIDAGKNIHAEMNEQEIVSSIQTPLRRKGFEETAPFNTSNRKSKNCATFYFKHRDTDSEADGSVEMEESSNVVDVVSSEDEWTYTNSRTEQVTCRKTNVKISLDFDEEVEDKDNKNDVQLSKQQTPISKRGNEKWNCEKKEIVSDDELSQDKYNIHRLVMEVEKLVREEGRVTPSRTLTPLIFEDRKGGDINSNRAKYARIREWLKLNSMGKYDEKSNSEYRSLDSCDASGEYTTGESDIEKQSISSEDLHSSVATYRRLDGYLGCVSQSVSQEIFDSTDNNTSVNECHQTLLPVDTITSTPKVVLRSKRKTNGPRPWSVSCITQIRNNSNANEGNDSISQFSISETALHQLVASSPIKSSSLDASGSSALFNKSTSTLLEETVSGQDARTIRTSSLRRRKSRLRKKTVSRKSESGSDGVNVHQTSGSSDVSSSNHHQCSKKLTSCRATTTRTIARDSHGRLTTLVKSGSFSGSLGQQELILTEKITVSDPVPALRLTYCQSNSSTSDTEEEDDTHCNRGKEHSNALNVDSDVEKNSLGNISFSEQAWDNYQEKYMSEPYSETPDLDAARRLLDFGDDYRNFLDSQSDCASSMSAIRDYSSPIPRRRIKTAVTEDSDSDVEDLCKLFKKSHCQLIHAENCVMKKGHLVGHECGEIVCMCRENIKCLHTILESSGISHRDDKHGKQIRGLLERWESLSSRLEEVQKANAIHRDMAAMHLEFRAAHDRIMAYEVGLEKAHILDERINQITSELATLKERKIAMLALNVSTHRLLTDLGPSAAPAFAALKDGVADLYRIWDETVQKGNQQLCALQAIQQFVARLTELQCALRRDKDALGVLDAALQAGATNEVASSVRDVARLLSEKQDNNCQNGKLMNETLKEEDTSENGSKFDDTTVICLTQEGGSLSDSGISDSGSEQELSERERRLAALRRLTRSLESQLAPGSEALAELWKRVEDAEAELRTLQKQCRELIVRTAASVESRSTNRASSPVNFPISIKRKKVTSPMDSEAEWNPKQKKKGCVTNSGDPESEPSEPNSWIWRILKAALPFQLALVALFCAACLLEPHCCEAANSLNLSLTPQLRYVRGPPPV